MTIKKLYEWALANNVEDYKLCRFNDWDEVADVKAEQFEVCEKEKIVVM